MSDESAADGQIRADGTHSLSVRVYYEDTDAGGVAYHAAYVRFFERARSDFLRAAGITHADLAALDTPVAFAVRRMEIDFLRPARLEQRLTVRTAFRDGAGPRLLADQEVAHDGDALARAVVEVACVSFDGRAVRPPKLLVNALAPYRGAVLKST